MGGGVRRGSFGGGYFRDISSGVTRTAYKDVWTELPPAWIDGLKVKRYVASPAYDASVNRYKVNCGVKDGKADSFGLNAWESRGWIHPQDPYGWFQWYCRFYQGRRSDDDERQISRWCKCAGERGRWKQNLVGKCLAANKSFDDPSVSPVVRQTLQHWGYVLTEKQFVDGAKRVRQHGAAYVPRQLLKDAGVVNGKS